MKERVVSAYADAPVSLWLFSLVHCFF